VRKENSMSTQARLDLKSLVESQCSGTNEGKDPWDWRPAPNCLAIRDVVNMFRFGATNRQIYHLSQCERCRRWLDNYAKSTSSVDFAVTQKSLFQTLTDWFNASLNRPSPTPALLYVLSNAIQVRNPGDTLAIEIAILAGASGKEQPVGSSLPEIDVHSLKLEGALVAEEGTLGWSEIERMTCPVIRFEKARLTSSPRKGIGKHFELTHSVYLTGRFAGSSSLPGFCGQADIQLVKAAAG
jgi:hypothetical protein